MNLTTCRQASIRRGLFLASAVLTFSVLAPVTLRASERWETLEAIHWIENPHNSIQPGPYGELGAYQFRETTWRKYTTVPFARAIERTITSRSACRLRGPSNGARRTTWRSGTMNG